MCLWITYYYFFSLDMKRRDGNNEVDHSGENHDYDDIVDDCE